MTATDIKSERIRLAIMNMRLARTQLRKAGADKAADAVAKALKSVEGAQRHAIRMASQETNKNEAAATNTDAPNPATTGGKGGDDPEYSERQQFLLDIMCGAMEGGTGYWAVARNVERDAELNYISFELADAEDEADSRQQPVKWSRVDPSVIERGILRIRDGEVEVNLSIRGRIVTAYYSNDAGITDANDCDCIVQAGIFNDIIYGWTP